MLMPCASRCSFKQTKNINTLNGPGRRSLGCPFWKVKVEKKIENFFSFFLKTAYFFAEGDENLGNFSEKLK